MPKKPSSICGFSQCSALAVQGERYCDKHAERKHGWSRGKRATAGNRHARGYGSKWDKIRKNILQRDDYLCVAHRRKGKLVPGNEVDHIVNKESGGTDHTSNLQTLCNGCHKEKTQKESNNVDRG